MSFNSGKLIRSLNVPKRNIAKSLNLSPDIRPLYNLAGQKKQSFPKKRYNI
jgi:hypothetical protein